MSRLAFLSVKDVRRKLGRMTRRSPDSDAVRDATALLCDQIQFFRLYETDPIAAIQTGVEHFDLAAFVQGAFREGNN